MSVLPLPAPERPTEHSAAPALQPVAPPAAQHARLLPPLRALLDWREPYLIPLVLLLATRAVLVVMYFNGYLQSAYKTTLWPLLGFLFLPVTTICYAWVINSHGAVDGLYTVAITLAVLFDLGILSSARRSRGDDD